MNKKVAVKFKNLGLIDYKEAWDYQETLFNKVVAAKQSNRDHREHKPTPNYILFCQHPHVYTLGKSGKETNLLISEDFLKSKGASFYHINRGGDITYHGPGQIVGYPILDLDNFGLSIKSYIHNLEEVIICSLGHFGITATRLEGATGVWLDADNPARSRKICAIGVRTSHWVSMHGFALNVNTDLAYFDYIVPCGITGKAVTSMQKELGKEMDIDEVMQVLKEEFENIFGMEIGTK
ncbi:MAG: lipoyl(octanoyl) transferase LipB [Chlorobi bacterium]|nr:lipoyl(octanoyl) transferase LipB [Chlorobiota bacterium]